MNCSDRAGRSVARPAGLPAAALPQWVRRHQRGRRPDDSRLRPPPMPSTYGRTRPGAPRPGVGLRRPKCSRRDPRAAHRGLRAALRRLRSPLRNGRRPRPCHGHRPRTALHLVQLARRHVPTLDMLPLRRLPDPAAGRRARAPIPQPPPPVALSFMDPTRSAPHAGTNYQRLHLGQTSGPRWPSASPDQSCSVLSTRRPAAATWPGQGPLPRRRPPVRRPGTRAQRPGARRE